MLSYGWVEPASRDCVYSTITTNTQRKFCPCLHFSHHVVCLHRHSKRIHVLLLFKHFNKHMATGIHVYAKECHLTIPSFVSNIDV